MNRREARILAMQYVFQMEAQNNFITEELSDFISDKKPGNQMEYITSIINSVCKNLDEIDDVIGKNSSGWTVPRMAKADLAILRLAVAEILYDTRIPKSVSINGADRCGEIRAGGGTGQNVRRR